MVSFKPSNKKFSVDAYDNFRFPVAYDWMHIGGYDDLNAAITACKQVIDEFYRENIEADDSADDLFKKYLMYGEVPCITGSYDETAFNSQNYAIKRSEELTKMRRN